MSRKKKTLPDDRQSNDAGKADPPSERKIILTGDYEDAGAEAAEAEIDEAQEIAADDVEKLIREKDEIHDRLLRTQADFDNYRKRIQKEQANLLRYGSENALREILPVLDNLELAIESARTHSDSNSQLLEGMELILTQFLGILERLNVKPIEAVGHPFDPNKHDGLLRVHAPELSEGAVVKKIRRGYYLYDKVLRPAQVTVGTHEQVQEPGQPSEEGE